MRDKQKCGILECVEDSRTVIDFPINIQSNLSQHPILSSKLYNCKRSNIQTYLLINFGRNLKENVSKSNSHNFLHHIYLDRQMTRFIVADFVKKC